MTALWDPPGDAEPGDVYDERMAEIWAPIPAELGQRQSWELAKPLMRSAQLEADRALHGEGEPDRTPGVPHPDRFLAERGWHAGPYGGIYTRRQEPQAEAEAGG